MVQYLLHFLVISESSHYDIYVLFEQVEEDHTGYIHLDRFLPAMSKVLLENK